MSADAESSHNSAFVYGLQGKLQFGTSQHGTLPYELRSLETLLLMVISELDIEFDDLCKPVNQVLDELGHDVSLERLKKLLDVSKQVSAFQQKVALVRKALHTVLEADDDMAAMYLSEKAAGKPRAEEDHADVEMLLENYYEASGEIVEKADNLLSDVEYTHDR
jgi:magnesium transporter